LGKEIESFRNCPEYFLGICMGVTLIGSVFFYKEKTEPPTYLPLGWAESPLDLPGLILESSNPLILSCISFKEWIPTSREND
jgi:hypothetical protein